MYHVITQILKQIYIIKSYTFVSFSMLFTEHVRWGYIKDLCLSIHPSHFFLLFFSCHICTVGYSKDLCPSAHLSHFFSFFSWHICTVGYSKDLFSSAHPSQFLLFMTYYEKLLLYFNNKLQVAFCCQDLD